MINHKITLIPGDGIGPEIVSSTVEILDVLAKKHNRKFEYETVLAGGCSIDKYGSPLTEETLAICKNSKAILLGAIGGPKWDLCPKRPETAILGLRKELNLFANIRPCEYRQYVKSSPLSDKILEKGIDIIMVRELTGGIYFGERGVKEINNVETHYDTEQITNAEIERVVKLSFEIAMSRSKKLCSVDKANVLHTSKVWRSIVVEMAKQYPEVEVSHMYVDNCAMQLVLRPSQFDVIVTGNMFGDILSDIMAATVGSIGIMPSYSYANDAQILYEPIHGSAPDIAGKNLANPIGTILSAAIMLERSFNEKEMAKELVDSVNSVLEKGYRTADMFKEESSSKLIKCTTEEMTKQIISTINNK